MKFLDRDKLYYFLINLRFTKLGLFSPHLSSSFFFRLKCLYQVSPTLYPRNTRKCLKKFVPYCNSEYRRFNKISIRKFWYPVGDSLNSLVYTKILLQQLFYKDLFHNFVYVFSNKNYYIYFYKLRMVSPHLMQQRKKLDELYQFYHLFLFYVVSR